jgi:CheY-like chemotaxis protein
MARLFYVHWHEDEATTTARKLRAAGHKVDYHWNSGAQAWRLLKDKPPDALVISLDRLPSHGRAVAEVIHESKRLRELPIIFVGGQPEKVATTRSRFPNAIYCAVTRLEKVLKKVRPFTAPDPAIMRTRKKPAGTSRSSESPSTTVAAGYSGTPLPQKLGIKPGHRIALVNAPTGFTTTLGQLPADVAVDRTIGDGQTHDVILLFCRSLTDLERGFAAAARRLDPAGGLWVSWPKKSSGVATDLTESVVREVGLASGLVDNKICAVDETWSGLRFVVRVKDRPKSPRKHASARG